MRALFSFESDSSMPAAMAGSVAIGPSSARRMRKGSKPVIAALLVAAATHSSASAQTVTFDFDSGTPVAALGSSLPLKQTTQGVTAEISSPNGAGYSFQNSGSTGLRLSSFSGKFLYPNSPVSSPLVLQFSTSISAISLAFATVDYPDNAETPSLLKLSAFNTAAPTNSLGSVTGRGTYADDSFPMGVLTLNSAAKPFDRVVIEFPPQTGRVPSFLIDNVTLTPAPIPAPKLSIHWTATNHLVVAWPVVAASFVLQVGDLESTGSWTNAPWSPTAVGDAYQVTVPPAFAHAFFLLKQP